MEVDRFDVYLVNLDPTLGSEIQKSSTLPGRVANERTVTSAW